MRFLYKHWALSFTVALGTAAAADLRLIEAAKSGNEAATRSLLGQRVDVNAAQGDGSTALHFAADADNLPIADILIRAGGRVDAANDLGGRAIRTRNC